MANQDVFSHVHLRCGSGETHWKGKVWNSKKWMKFQTWTHCKRVSILMSIIVYSPCKHFFWNITFFRFIPRFRIETSSGHVPVQSELESIPQCNRHDLPKSQNESDQKSRGQEVDSQGNRRCDINGPTVEHIASAIHAPGSSPSPAGIGHV